MPGNNTSWEQGVLSRVVGEQLSSVEFVQDYVQLRFDGPTLTCFTRPEVELRERTFRWGEPGYRDELCARIASKVVEVSVLSGDAIRIRFADGAEVKVSLRDADYRCAEAAKFDVSRGGEWWVL